VRALRGHHSDFWRQMPGLAWSNPKADDSVLIRAALLRPRFGRILEIALEFSVQRVGAEWRILIKENTLEARRAKAAVERILRNIKKGFARASARN
jgi:hypothetical protein